MKLLLIRHGQSVANIENRLQGQVDSPLSDRGREQAHALARRLEREEWEITTLYSSDLSRAAETAEILADRLGLPVVYDARLREYDYGQWSGLTWDEIGAVLRQTGAVSSPDAGWPSIPGEEGQESFHRRLIAALDDIRAGHRDGEVVGIVAHGGSLGVLLSHLLGIPPRRFPPFILENASLSIIAFHPLGPRLFRLNDTCHLEQK